MALIADILRPRTQHGCERAHTCVEIEDQSRDASRRLRADDLLDRNEMEERLDSRLRALGRAVQRHTSDTGKGTLHYWRQSFPSGVERPK